MTQPIDFTQPIEHVDGTHCRVAQDHDCDDGWMRIERADGRPFSNDQSCGDGPQGGFLVNRFGERYSGRHDKQFIRNRQPQPSRIPDDVVERMVRLVHCMCKPKRDLAGEVMEANAIAKTIPDADRDIAKEIAEQWYSEVAPHLDPLLEALKRGRELAANEKGEG